MSEVATLGAGCFWCVEAIFKELKGVEKVISGYSGGTVPNPSYEQVCEETTGHAEAIQITFDKEILSYEKLLEIFFKVHDPTTKDRQGNNVGPSYRSVIFYHDENQKKTAEKVFAEIDKSGIYQNKLVTEITPLTNFYEAENYHQEFYRKNQDAPYCQFVINPELAKFRKEFNSLLKENS